MKADTVRFGAISTSGSSFTTETSTSGMSYTVPSDELHVPSVSYQTPPVSRSDSYHFPREEKANLEALGIYDASISNECSSKCSGNVADRSCSDNSDDVKRSSYCAVNLPVTAVDCAGNLPITSREEASIEIFSDETLKTTQHCTEIQKTSRPVTTSYLTTKQKLLATIILAVVLLVLFSCIAFLCFQNEDLEEQNEGYRYRLIVSQQNYAKLQDIAELDKKMRKHAETEIGELNSKNQRQTAIIEDLEAFINKTIS